jgi:hypothetical protein
MDYYDIKRISNSYLSSFKRKLLGLPERTNTSAMHFGRGFHQMVLEPHNFNHMLHSGADRFTMLRMAASLRATCPPQMLLGQKEAEYMYHFYGLPCKLKADIIKDKVITDIKTTTAKTAEEFIRSAIEYDYPRQGAWYMDCPQIQATSFVIIGVCKSPPHQVFVWKMDKDSPHLEAGREEYLYLLDQLKQTAEVKQFN